MASPGQPVPGNNWLGYQYDSKPSTWHGNYSENNKYLNNHLYYLSGQNVPIFTNTFNSNTYYAVRNYQAFFGLTVDGWVGAQTWGVLDWQANL